MSAEQNLVLAKLSNMVGQAPVLDLAKRNMMPPGHMERLESVIQVANQEAFERIKAEQEQIRMNAAVEEQTQIRMMERAREQLLVEARAEASVAAQRANAAPLAADQSKFDPNAADQAALAAIGAVSSGEGEETSNESEFTKSSAWRRAVVQANRVVFGRR